ncbi:MAG: agmatinase [Candidatus Methylarchaceae archaeon HK01B]|nr:agmatinase [Candidatus Methylarchaceae archaeon HK01M]MCP8312204.1 agmatinase [Candidatus Methylarchaceae archaeon HK02M1]MCP8319198.1 agmatinase [Candidatus Methylarchaceae archaeon HK01B]
MSYKDLFITPEPLITSTEEGIETVAMIFGVPFDATTTFRPGARFGPNAIRQAYMNIETYSPQLDVDLDRLSIKDLGNLKSTSNVEEMIYSVGKVVDEIVRENVTFGVLGGEHSLTFGSYLSVPKDTALIVFDAHLDLRDEFSGLKMSHATFLRRLTDKIGTNSTVHIGSRAASGEEWRIAEKIGLFLISSQIINTVNNAEKLLTDFLKDFKNVYVSIDLDVLDPAFAPAVSNPEPDGMSTRKLFEFLYSLRGKKIVGFDIVELTPLYDNGTTAVLAAKVMTELIGLSYMAQSDQKF